MTEEESSTSWDNSGVVFVMVAAFLILLGAGVGGCCMKCSMMDTAVKLGHAEWVQSDGGYKFQWKEVVKP